MSSLYYIRLTDETSHYWLELEVISMKKVRAVKHLGTYINNYDLDFSNSNPGLVEDMIKVLEYIREKLEVTTNERADVYIDAEILSSSIEFDGQDDIWECLLGAIKICEGEHLMQKGSKVMTEGYDLIEKYVSIN